MNQPFIETLKWVIGLPAALVALLTLPYVILKYRLECRKLRCELRKLEAELSPAALTSASKIPGTMFTWMAFYWAIPCYGSMVIFGLAAGLARSPLLAGLAVGVSLMFLVTGKSIAERYTVLTSRRSP